MFHTQSALVGLYINWIQIFKKNYNADLASVSLGWNSADASLIFIILLYLYNIQLRSNDIL